MDLRHKHAEYLIRDMLPKFNRLRRGDGAWLTGSLSDHAYISSIVIPFPRQRLLRSADAMDAHPVITKSITPRREGGLRNMRDILQVYIRPTKSMMYIGYHKPLKPTMSL